MCEFLHHLLAGQLAFVHPLQRGHQRVLHQRQARRRLRVGLLLLLQVCGAWSVASTSSTSSASAAVIASRSDTSLIAGLRSQVALGRVVRARGECRKCTQVSAVICLRLPSARISGPFSNSANSSAVEMAHMEAGAVLACQRHRQAGRRDARFARTDVGCMSGTSASPYFSWKAFRLASIIGVSSQCVMIGVGHSRKIASSFRVVDQHVAGRSAHEHLHARGLLRVQRTDRFEVVIAGAMVEAVVGPGGARASSYLASGWSNPASAGWCWACP